MCDVIFRLLRASWASTRHSSEDLIHTYTHTNSHVSVLWLPIQAVFVEVDVASDDRLAEAQWASQQPHGSNVEIVAVVAGAPDSFGCDNVG